MSDEPPRQKSRTGVRRARSIYQVHYNIQKRNTEVMAKPLVLPLGLGVQAFGLQVAGHQALGAARYTGLLQCSNGTVLKPILKPSQQREVDFYSRLGSSAQPDLVELRAFVPHCYGVTKYTYNGYEQEYIMLEDLTQRMLEQCVMDVKIGKRTWDPLATEEKIKSEQSKYAQCKQQFGFCIPGYQVCELATGRLRKYGKEHGKRLQGNMVIDALKKYLNFTSSRPCRALLLALLAPLWRLQRWARAQRALRLYGASLLLIYDAARLRRCCGPRAKSPGACGARLLPGGVGGVGGVGGAGGGGPLGGQLAARGPLYRLRRTPALHTPPLSPPQRSTPSPWSEALDKLTSNHSFEHNYEEELCKIRVNYRTLLDEMSTDEPNPHGWGTVKIIDFAHAFFNGENEMAVDENFRDGVDSLVEIFETFLRETDEGGGDVPS